MKDSDYIIGQKIVWTRHKRPLKKHLEGAKGEVIGIEGYWVKFKILTGVLKGDIVYGRKGNIIHIALKYNRNGANK